MIKQLLKRVLSATQLRQLRRIKRYVTAKYFAHDLNKLAELYGCDKWGKHFYTPHYAFHFKKFRFKKINLFEIGVGGYEDPHNGGSSLRMWKKFFPFANIVSIDIYDKSTLQENRIKIYKGSQVDEPFLESIAREVGHFDIIIDDGSHVNKHVIESFRLLFPKLKDGGIYVVEDTQTSYWPDYGGDSQNLNNPDTIMNFFKNLTDCLNHMEFQKPGDRSSYLDQNIVAIHFYHNLIFIHKGHNDEKQYGRMKTSRSKVNT